MNISFSSVNDKKKLEEIFFEGLKEANVISEFASIDEKTVSLEIREGILEEEYIFTISMGEKDGP